jgi:hypothetical protein
MQQPDSRAERLHARVWELLPWHANGTLAPAERATVEGHLDGCARCRMELEACRDTAQALRSAPGASAAPHPAQLSRLLARIEAAEAESDRPRAWGRLGGQPGSLPGGEPSGQPRGELGPLAAGAPRLGRLRQVFALTPRPVRWALAAQLALLLGLSLLFRPAARPGYVVLSDPPPVSTAGGAPEIRVVFAEDATERQIRALLLQIHGRFTSGPSPLGTYTVAVPPASRAGDPLDVVISYLRKQPAVRFAQPVAGTPASPSAGSPSGGPDGAGAMGR